MSEEEPTPDSTGGAPDPDPDASPDGDPDADPDGDAGEPARRREIDWTRWSLIVSTSTAAVGLILSAVATWLSVRAAQDQTDQAREQAKTEEAKQANRVTTWLKLGEKDHAVHIVANRSLDPVFATSIRIPEILRSSDGKRTIIYTLHQLGQIPPCTSVMVDSGAWAFGTTTLIFSDTSGQSWERHSNGSLVQRDQPGGAAERPMDAQWKTSKLDDCGSND